MRVEDTVLDGVKLIIPRVHGDDRGFFSEVYNARDLAEAGIDLPFVQDNHSFSATPGVLRGLHFQVPPAAQDKLVRVTHGRIFDVAVDLRAGSATFGRHVAFELSRANWRQLLVPAGFAHGFVTLEPDTEVLYKVTTHYAAECDAGVYYADPEIGIEWPVAVDEIHLSNKDARLPSLASFRPRNPF